MKGFYLIKVLVLSIHPPYISWFYHNQSNFSMNYFPHASYGPEQKTPLEECSSEATRLKQQRWDVLGGVI